MGKESEFFTARQVLTRYGISAMALSRWLIDKNLSFPQPLVIKTRRYFSKQDILEWEQERRKVDLK